MKNYKLIESLSNLHGAPGFEDDVTDFIKNQLKGFSVERDSINNLFVRRSNDKPDNPVVALDCHTDEVAFMVERINQNGTISFLPLGGWHAANIPAHAVVIKNSKNEYIKGVVASKPPHFMTAEEKATLPKIEDLVIDIGTSSREDTAAKYHIETGNPVTPDVTFCFDPKTNVVRGKAFDNRLGCAAVISVLKNIKTVQLPVSPVGLFCSQEEVGLRGAQVAATNVRPDFAIVFEGCPADDTFKPADQAFGAIGKGVQFRVLDAGMVSNHRVQSFARKIANKHGIPYQIIARSGGRTNGSRYHMAMQGIPALVIGIPSRYIHTHYSYASLKDFDNAVLLAQKILAALSTKIIRSF